MTIAAHFDMYSQRPSQARSFDVQLAELGIDPMRQSPLELRLGAALLHLMLDPGEFGPPHFLNLFLPRHEVMSLDDFPPVRPIKEGVINAAPGTWWDKYQTDFMLCVKAPRARKSAWGAVECDGHDFHEKTSDQVSHDRARDREFQAGGIAVLRFPGCQVNEDATKCAREAIQVLLRQSAGRRQV